MTSSVRPTQASVPEQWALRDTFVPKGRYVDPDFARLEHERLFPNVWQMACREEELPNPGSFHEYAIGDRSILVVRQPDGSLRAMHNACRHRGMKIIGGAGRVDEFRCRFHGFRYALDGACTFVFCPEEFADRSAAEWALQPVHVDTWGGWVFVNPASDPPALLEWLDPIPSLLDPFRLADMRYRWCKTVVIPANWKTVIDAFVEGFHTPGTHPQTLRPTEGTEPSARPASVDEYAHAPFSPTFALGGNHSVMKYGERPDKGPQAEEWAAVLARPDVYANLMQYLARSLGAMQTERDARAAEMLATMEPSEVPPIITYLGLCKQLAQEEGVVTYPDMSIEQHFAGCGDYHIFPTMVILVEPGSTLGYRMRPNGNDPDSCVWDLFSLEHYAPGAEPNPKWEVFPNWREADLGPFLAQDLKNIPDIQAGMHSDGFEGLWLNGVQETTIVNAHRVADRYLFGVDEDAS